ncbi:hypothetical protein GOV09_05375 [Candidatus Woesearchaeota archaeon]|nr:hypothetical protein [Candidatus Woesearchaeota archaeon]
MRIPKKYGFSRKINCPFCQKPSLTENQQGVPVCIQHKNKVLEIKCLCGDWLDIRKGKFGGYGKCMKCGNVNLSKVL